MNTKVDAVNHPPHYNSHPTGVECIDIIEVFPANVANAMKYLWRAGLKGDAVEDLEKAIWYVKRQIRLIEHGSPRLMPVVPRRKR
jgi:hypothetical protein